MCSRICWSVMFGMVILFGAVAGTTAGEPDEGFVPIFNGKDLTGWDGAPRLWSVKGGVIRGETTKENPTKGNTFLIWRGGTVDDFELRLSFRIRSGNSGVQYRSRDLGKWRVAGYQAEVCNNRKAVGFLYHERGRKRLAEVGQKVVIDKNGKKRVVGSLGDVEKIQAGYKENDWNHYRIIARGNHLVHYLNGIQTIDLVDNDKDAPARRALSGILALQIHAGPPMTVEFKNIRLKKLDKPEDRK